jgi:hypothetical protein
VIVSLEDRAPDREERDVSRSVSRKGKVTFDSLNSTSLSLHINRLLHRVHCTEHNQSKFKDRNQSI